MKKNCIVLILALCSVLPTTLFACEFKFKVKDEEKKEYKVGDEIIVTVELQLTHRSCPEGLEKTKFDFKGLKALGATKWEETGHLVYERKFKLLVTKEKKNSHLFSALRTCDKDGGSGSIEFTVK